MRRIRNEATDARTMSESFARLGIPLPEGAAAALAEYLALVAKWNHAYNLTAVREPGEMVARHVLDSAAALPFLRGTRMLDAGSGAGFPGLVLALLAPDTTWVLVASNGKKARFLDHAVRRLGLGGRVSIHAGRLESYRPQPGFDTVTARALAALAVLTAWTAPLLVPGGRIVALKGRRAEIETELAALPAGWHTQLAKVAVPGETGERHVVVLERETGK